MATVELDTENFERAILAFKDGSLVFSRPGALPAAAPAQVVTAVRELDIEQIRPDNDYPRSA